MVECQTIQVRSLRFEISNFRFEILDVLVEYFFISEFESVRSPTVREGCQRKRPFLTVGLLTRSIQREVSNHSRNSQPQESLHQKEHEPPEAEPFDPGLCRHLQLLPGLDELNQLKRSTKTNKAELVFLRAYSCEFVDRSYPSQKRARKQIRTPQPLPSTFS
jgi:ribosomal protein S8